MQLFTHSHAHTHRLLIKRMDACDCGSFHFAKCGPLCSFRWQKPKIQNAADQTGNPLSSVTATVLAFCPATEGKKKYLEVREGPRTIPTSKTHTDAKSLGFMSLRSRYTNTCTKTSTTAHPSAVTHTRTHTGQN